MRRGARHSVRVRRRARPRGRGGRRAAHSVAAAQHRGRSGRRLADARGRAASARRGGSGARGPSKRRARSERRRAEGTRGDADDQRGLRPDDSRRARRGAARDRERYRARAGDRLAGRGEARQDDPALLGGDVRRRSVARRCRSPSRAARPTQRSRAAGCRTIARRSECSSTGDGAAPHGGGEIDARTLLKVGGAGLPRDEDARRAAGGARPVGRGRAAMRKRRAGARARERGRGLFDEGSPSLLNEAPVFLALHDACIDLGGLEEARAAIARGVPRLVTRVKGPRGHSVCARVPDPARAQRGAPRRRRGLRDGAGRGHGRARGASATWKRLLRRSLDARKALLPPGARLGSKLARAMKTIALALLASASLLGCDDPNEKARLPRRRRPPPRRPSPRRCHRRFPPPHRAHLPLRGS